MERDEPPFQLYPNLSSVGYSRGQHLVYVADGLFRDQADVDSHAEQTLGYIPQPGDIKYVDQPDANGNCDGIINTNDRVYMGYPEDPEIVYGFGPSMKYKNWDFSFFLPRGSSHFYSNVGFSSVWEKCYSWCYEVYR